MFTALDARNAFNQLRLSERSQRLVAFSTYINGIRQTYTTVGMPFGINGGPAYYQRMIDSALYKFKRPHSDVEAYLDDLTLGSRASKEKSAIDNHLDDLERVLARLHSISFKMRLSKCKFLQEKIEVWGGCSDS